MTSIPASRSARAMILAPRSCPSRPGLATTTRILRSEAITSIIRRTVGSLLGCSLVAMLLAGSGLNGHPVATTVQDDALLLHRSDGEVRASMRQISELGADY